MGLRVFVNPGHQVDPNKVQLEKPNIEMPELNFR
jgi:hypothetical protein